MPVNNVTEWTRKSRNRCSAWVSSSFKGLRDDPPQILTLPPNGKGTVTGRIDSDDVPVGKAQALTVTVRRDNKDGDILFGDIDGVCLIPTEAADEVFAKALEKVRGEKLVRKALEEGSSAIAAFEKHGIM